MSYNVYRRPKFDRFKFIEDCRNDRGKIFVDNNARIGALGFKLKNDDEIIDFIANNGIPDNPREIRNVDKIKTFKVEGMELPDKVDAYNFTTGVHRGYIAFMQCANGKWVIKSFKKSDT